MFMYFRLDHLLLAMCLSLAAARLRQDCPSGNAPTTLVRRRISFMNRSSARLSLPVKAVRMLIIDFVPIRVQGSTWSQERTVTRHR